MSGDVPGGGSLRERTFHGVAWSVVGVGGRSVMQVGVLVLLARLVPPEDFGVVAAAFVVINLATLLAEVGLGPALIQRTEITEVHVRVAFTGLLLTSLGAWLVVCWQADAIAGLLGVPRVAAVLPLVAATLWVRNITVADFLLSRELRFRELAVAQLQSYGLGYGLVAVVLALAGLGVWAIAIGHVCGTAANAILVWRRRPHSVRPSLAPGPLRDLFSYGSGHMLARLAGFAAVNGDNVVVGRWLGAAALGLYGRAYQLMVMPSELFGTVVNRVLFPAMSSIQRDRERLEAAWLTGTAVVALATVPVAVVGGLLAHELVLVVLGPDWSALEAAFTVMVAGIVLRTAAKLSDVVAQAAGAVYRRSARQGIYAAVVVVGALAGTRWGITGVAVAVVVAITTNAVLMAELGIRLTGGRFADYVAAFVPGAVLGVVTAAAVIPVAHRVRAAGMPALVVLLASGAAAAVALLLTARLAVWLRVPGSLARVLREVVAMSPSRVALVLRHLLGRRVAPVRPTRRDRGTSAPVPTGARR